MAKYSNRYWVKSLVHHSVQPSKSSLVRDDFFQVKLLLLFYSFNSVVGPWWSNAKQLPIEEVSFHFVASCNSSVRNTILIYMTPYFTLPRSWRIVAWYGKKNLAQVKHWRAMAGKEIDEFRWNNWTHALQPAKVNLNWWHILFSSSATHCVIKGTLRWFPSKRT